MWTASASRFWHHPQARVTDLIAASAVSGSVVHPSSLPGRVGAWRAWPVFVHMDKRRPGRRGRGHHEAPRRFFRENP